MGNNNTALTVCGKVSFTGTTTQQLYGKIFLHIRTKQYYSRKCANM